MRVSQKVVFLHDFCSRIRLEFLPWLHLVMHMNA